MSLVVQLAGLLAIYAGCLVGPGLWFVRRLPWLPLEKLCASIAASWLIVYLASFGLFAAGAPPEANYAVTAAAWIATLCCWRDLRKLALDRHVRCALFTWLGLVAWCFLGIFLVRQVSGGDWFGDWIEHYERAEFFLGKYPNDYKFIGLYLLPARLPLMNVVCAFLMAQVSTGFDIYQAIHILLGTLVVLPCCMLALTEHSTPATADKPAKLEADSRAARRQARRICLLLAGLFAFNPSFWQNLIFVWSKLFAAFFVVLAVYLYVQAWRSDSRSRMVASFATFAVGLLTHHSTGVYIALFVAHYLGYLFWKRGRPWRELAIITSVSFQILTTWFAWSFAYYGVRDTLTSNYVFRDFEASTGGGNDMSVVALNWLYSFVPFPLHGGESYGMFDHLETLSQLRDQAFMIYQVNLLPMMGSIGGLLVVYLLLAELWKRNRDISGPETWFWLALVTLLPLLGIGVVFSLSPFGLAYTSLQPLTIMGLTFLATRFDRLRRLLAGGLLIGLLVDFVLGVWLHLHMDHQTFQIGAMNNQWVVATPAEGNTPAAPVAVWVNSQWMLVNPFGPSGRTILNWISKNEHQYVFLGDHAANWGTAIQTAMLLICLAWIGFQIRQLAEPKPEAPFPAPVEGESGTG